MDAFFEELFQEGKVEIWYEENYYDTSSEHF